MIVKLLRSDEIKRNLTVEKRKRKLEKTVKGVFTGVFTHCTPAFLLATFV